MYEPRPLRLAALVLTGAMVLVAGCGDDAPGDDAGPGTTATTGPDGSDAGDCGSPTEPLAVAEAEGVPAAGGLDDGAAGEVPPPGDLDQFGLFDHLAIAVEDPSGEVTTSCVLLAVTSEQRQRGLMEVTDLAGYAGMLFVDGDERTQSFWMRNTPMPLSIAWFDDEGALVTALDMEPCGDDISCPPYGSEEPARFALEVPQGELAEVGVVEGSTLRVGGT